MSRPTDEKSNLFRGTAVPEPPDELRSRVLRAAAEHARSGAHLNDSDVVAAASPTTLTVSDRLWQSSGARLAWAASVTLLLLANAYVRDLPVHKDVISISSERREVVPLATSGDSSGDSLIEASLARQRETRRTSPETLAELEALVGELNLTGDPS